MIICMSDILCVTNRLLCKGDFLTRVEQIAKAGPRAVILREKDLSEEAYKALAVEVMALCRTYQTACILHYFPQTAIALNADSVHLPLPILRQMDASQRERFSVIGASCHSVQEAEEAERLGCTYITAGHIFNTDCKKDLPGRGLAFLRQVCRCVSIPVYAIGGIDRDNYPSVRQAGAAGACVMSGAMGCENVKTYLEGFDNAF